MDSDSVSWPAYDVRREALDELTPTEVFQAPQQHATRSGRAERCRYVYLTACCDRAEVESVFGSVDIAPTGVQCI